ncbi:MAG TPA: type II CAAX endopeptidase family protein [Vicinamibacteria bacterium]|nr:type II CAAX endopeptidase family protein [Vicinamibacteria bacterium]
MRPASLHPALALLAVVAGMLAMVAGLAAVAPRGLRAALVVGETLLALPGVLLVAVSGLPVARTLALHPVPRRTALLASLAGATLWAASLGLMNLQFAVWSPPPEFLESFRVLHQRLRPATVPEALLSVLAIGIMPALCEETLFRGVVLPSLTRWRTGTALVGSSLLFALIHVDSAGDAAVFHRVPFAFVVGLGLGALRLLTGSLLASMVAHAVLNTITFATVFLTGAASQAMDEPHAATGGLLLVGGGAATAWLFRVLRR